MHSIRFFDPKSLLSLAPTQPPAQPAVADEPPPGTVKSILPCTPLAIVKCLEYISVYNKILPYGDRLYGRTITVINRYDFQFNSDTMGLIRLELGLRSSGALLQPCFPMTVHTFTRWTSTRSKNTPKGHRRPTLTRQLADTILGML